MGTEAASVSPALTLSVHGLPAPQGSKRVVNGRLIEASHATQPWRQEVTGAALAAIESQGQEGPLLGPVAVHLTFVLPRPKGHFGSGRNAGVLRGSAPALPSSKPDSDKLARAVLDALTTAGVWRDDSQVVDLVAVKRFAGSPGVSLMTPGVLVEVSALPATLEHLAAGDGQKR